MIKKVQSIISHFSLPVFNKPFSFCYSCHKNKSHRLPFVSRDAVVSSPLDLVVPDVWGPVPVTFYNGYQSTLSLSMFSVDLFGYLHYLINLMLCLLFYFKANIENLLSCKIKCFQSANGGEFIKFKSFLGQHGLSQRFLCLHTPQQNGIAERRHRRIVESGLSLMDVASAPSKFWVDAFQNACYPINIIPS